MFREKLLRKQFFAFMQTHPGCRVAMEACATAHHLTGTLMVVGHSVRLLRRLLIIGVMAVISGAKVRPPAENS